LRRAELGRLAEARLDPLIGRRDRLTWRPSPERARGYGLWVVRQLADVVTTHSDHTGTAIALDFPLTTRP
jgi:hypothetical protein